MTSRHRFITVMVGLFLLLGLGLSATAVSAVSNISITISGTYWASSPTVCGNDNVYIDANISGTATTNDSGGYDYFAILWVDAKGNVMDVDIYDFSLGAFSNYTSDDIGIGSLSNPVARPFTAVVYDIPYYAPAGGENTPTAAAWIQANGSQVYSLTFDPSFVPGCAALPLAGGACLALPDGSVVGDMPFQTQAYYEPGKVSPGVFVNPGTYWVIGEDDSGQYYKILLSCQFLWVPVQNMQPSYQPPWSGQPLPTRVVS